MITLNIRQAGVLTYLYRLFGVINNIEGSIVECGVGKGQSFLYLNFHAFWEKKNRMVWGLDSFEGFPEPAEEDAGPRNPQKGEWSDTSERDMWRLLRDSGLPDDWLRSNVRIVKGFFEKSLSEYRGGPIAFLHIDADLYESYREALTVLYPLVVRGGDTF